jgi:hypothetical protein
MLDIIVRSAICNSSPAIRARLLGNATQFIKNTEFTNLLQNIDINNPKSFNYSVFLAFMPLKDIHEQVAKWIKG